MHIWHAECSREELPHVPSQGRRAEGATPSLRSGVVAESARLWQSRSSQEELPPPKARGSGREELPHFQGAVAAQVPEGLEELFHVQGQERQQWGDTPRPR